MRRPVLAVCVAVVSMVSGACAKPVLDPLGLVQVDVSITCTGDGVQSSVSPYVVRVPEGYQVAWKLSENSTVSEIEIDRKKRLAPWPYDGPLPYRGTKENPPRAGRMKAGQVDKRFSYNIAATCTAAGGEARRIVIDPDMIIIRRPTTS